MMKSTLKAITKKITGAMLAGAMAFTLLPGAGAINAKAAAREADQPAIVQEYEGLGDAAESNTNYMSGPGCCNSTKPTVTKTVKKICLKKTTVQAKDLNATSFSLRWKSVNGAGGYEVQYAKSITMKNATTCRMSGNNNCCRVKNLKKNSFYFARVRAYRINSDGTKSYSSWSAIVLIKTRKSGI